MIFISKGRTNDFYAQYEELVTKLVTSLNNTIKTLNETIEK